MQAENQKSVYSVASKYVHLKIYENGPQYLICLPGLGLNGESFIPALPAQYSWVLVDYNAYAAEIRPDICGLESTAEEIVRLLHAQGIIKNLHIIAHSMGGVVAALCTEKCGFSGWLNLEGNLDPEDCFFSRRIFRYDHDEFIRSSAAEYFDLLRRSASVIENNSISQYLDQIEHINYSALWFHARDTVKLTDNFYSRDRFLAFNAPKIYIVGDETRWTPTLRAAVESNGLNTCVISGSGHFMLNDNPQEVKKCIVDFLK